MNIWENAIITEKGLALLSKLTQGNSLIITEAKSGAGYVTAGLLVKQTSVTTPKQSLSFRSASYPEDGKSSVTCYLTNDGLTEGYTANQIGVYATDPDEGSILFFIAQAASGTGTIIPTATESPGYSAEWTFTFRYGQADGVSVAVDPSNTVTITMMEEYVSGEISSESTTMKNYVDREISAASTELEKYIDSEISTVYTDMDSYMESEILAATTADIDAAMAAAE